MACTMCTSPARFMQIDLNARGSRYLSSRRYLCPQSALFKTTRGRYPVLASALRAEHPYGCPPSKLPCTEVPEAFAAWVDANPAHAGGSPPLPDIDIA